ncbi:MAG: MFS transporter [Bacillota bacterium]
MSDLAKIEVVPNATSAERVIYYEQMINALLAGGYELPFLEGAREWGALRREPGALKTRSFYSSGIRKRSREIGFFLFSITPVIEINGKAIFVGKVPSADQLIEAIRSSLLKKGDKPMKTDRSTWSIFTVILAMFFGTMEMTVIITALPTLGRAFPQTGSWLPWLTTATLMAAAIAMPIGGYLADNWGVKKAFLLGLAFFSLGSLFGGLVGLVLPHNMGLLIGSRFLQGFGGGIFAPVGFKWISVVYKGRLRTKTIGLAGMVTPLAAVLGPNLGGFLVDHFPWQVIFLYNALMGMLIALLAGVFMQEVVTERRKSPLDVGGIAIFSGVILSSMLALTLTRHSGFTSPLPLGLLIVTGSLIILLIRFENRYATPLLDPVLLTAKGMSVILGMSFLQGLIMYSTLFFLSFYAQTHPSILATPTQAGALLTPGALAQMLAAPLVGKFIPKVGYRLMIMGGMLITAGSLLAMFWGPTSLVALSIILVFSRVGGTMASIPLAAIGLEVNVRSAGIISGLRQLSNVLGGVVGPVVLSVIFPLSRAEGGRPEYVFVLMGLLVLLALPAAHGIPNRESEVSIISQTPNSGENK